jgi:hypothetical protein
MSERVAPDEPGTSLDERSTASFLAEAGGP